LIGSRSHVASLIMRKDAIPDPRLGWQFSAVDKLRAELSPAWCLNGGSRKADGSDDSLTS
jgi:hypothetical protein